MALALLSIRFGQMAQDLAGAGKYPTLGPLSHNLLKRLATCEALPYMEKSSAYQGWRSPGWYFLRSSARPNNATPYSSMPSGQPCVTPSLEKMN